MNITPRRTQVILEALEEKHCLECCSTYGEPGYTDPEKSVLLCNWNNVKPALGDYLEEAGYTLEWSDEWTISHEHDKAYRTQPDSYGWRPQTTITTDGELLTPDDDISDWLWECALTDYSHPPKALPSWIGSREILDEGYEKVARTHESGFYPGQNDDPRQIAEELFSQHGVESVVFQVTGSGQFDIAFAVYVKRWNM